MNISSIPYPRIYQCLIKLALYSCGFTDHNFVLNAKGIWAVWIFVKTFLPEYAIKKITFLYQDKTPLLQIIQPGQLQKKYGGSQKDIQQDQYFPPLSSPKCAQSALNINQSQQNTDFYSVQNNQDIFQQIYQEIDHQKENPNNQSGCCGSTYCNIY